MEDLVELFLRDLGTLLGLGIERVADDPPLGLLGQAFDEFIVDLGFDEQAAAGRAALAAVEVDRVERTGDGGVEVGVGEYHVRALAAQLESRALERIGRGLLDDLGRIDVAGEGDLVDIRVGDECRAGRLAHAVDDIDDTVRETRLAGELGHPERRERRLLGRLEHDRVPAGQGGSPLPREHQQREVPGDDLADHSDGLPQGIREEVATDRDGPAFDLVGPAGVIPERVADPFHVPLGIRDRLAAVERLEGCQVGGVLLDQVGQLEQEFPLFGGVHGAPGARLQRPSRRLHRPVDVGRARGRDLRDDIARGRVIRLKLAAIDRVYPLVIDEQLGGLDLRLGCCRGCGFCRHRLSLPGVG